MNSSIHLYLIRSFELKLQHVTQTVSLVIFTCFLFLRIHFLLKLLIATLITAIYCWLIWITDFLTKYRTSDAWNANVSPQISHTLSVCLLTITLHVLDRQVS